MEYMMVRYGKYTPDQKLEKLADFWRGVGQQGPELAETDRFRRQLLKKWDYHAKRAGQIAVHAYVRDHASNLDSKAAAEIVDSFCRSGLTGIAADLRFLRKILFEYARFSRAPRQTGCSTPRMMEKYRAWIC